MNKLDFFQKAIPAALAAKHVFPEFAACEAALESGWGESKLAKAANNLFGQKHGFSTEDLEIIEIPTKEWIHGEEVIVAAQWPKFKTWQASFEARMELLRRASVYHIALAASDGRSFILLVSRVWATDPHRGDKVLATYDMNRALIQQVMAAQQPAGK